MEPPRISPGSDECSGGTYVVEPLAAHTHTLILLHGLSSNGTKFGKELLETGITSIGKTLPQLLPGARFVFPTAKRRRSSAFKRSLLTQWFDIARLEDPEYRKETQLQGLEESAAQLQPLIKEEVAKVSARNVILGGISQGSAMSMSILIASEYSLGGYVGLCSYLPYQNDIKDAAASELEDSTDEDDPFARDSDNGHSESCSDPAVKGMEFERDLLGLPPIQNPTRANTAVTTPVFLGHGEADEKKPYTLGLGASKTLQTLGFEVIWKLYPELGHWYKVPDEIDDVVEFIRSSVGWEVA
jgi:predicted esterase